MDLCDFLKLPPKEQKRVYRELKEKEILFKRQMAHRCESDVKINWLLWQKMQKRLEEIYASDT